MAKKFTFTGTAEVQDDGAVRVLGVISQNELPEAPQGLRLVQLSDAFVEIAWEDSADATSWQVVRDSVQIDTSALATYRDETVSPDTDYEYQVRAVNGAGVSELSPILEVHTEAQLVPAVPTGLESPDAGSTFISIVWDEVPDVLNWDVYRDGGLIATSTVANYTDSPLDPSISYTYRVLARNEAGVSALSDPLVVTTLANNAPVWIAVPAQTATVGTAYSLSCPDFCTDLDTPTLLFSVASGGVPGLAISGTSYAGVPTTANTYQVVLRADDGEEFSDVTVDFDVAAASDTTAPPVPTNVVATANGSDVTVSWTEVTDPSGIWAYRVRRDNVIVTSLVGGVAFDTAQAGAVDGPPITYTGLANGTYVFDVRAIDNSPAKNASASGFATAVTVNVGPSTPAVPINFAVVATSSSATSSTWAAGVNGPAPTSYQIDRSLTGNDAQNPAAAGWTQVFSGLALTDTDTGLTANTTYHYRIRALTGAIPSSGYAVDSVATLSGSGQFLLQDDFSSTTWYTQWHDPARVYANNPPFTYQNSPPRVTRVPSTYTANGYAPRAGGSGNAIQVTIAQGSNTGTTLSFFPRLSALGSNPTELFIEYWVRFGSTWIPTSNGKLPGIAGDFGDGGKGNAWAADGMNGWSARSTYFNPCSDGRVAFGSYLYAVEDGNDVPIVTPQNDPGRGFAWTGMNCGGSAAMNKNQWYKIKVYCKANTGSGAAAQRNGIIRGWVDDVQRAENTQLMWTRNASYLAIDRAWFDIYHGGPPSAAAQTNLHVFFADVRVWVP